MCTCVDKEACVVCAHTCSVSNIEFCERARQGDSERERDRDRDIGTQGEGKRKEERERRPAGSEHQG